MSVDNSVKRICLTQSGDRRDVQDSEPEPQALLQEEKDFLRPSKLPLDSSEDEIKQNGGSSSRNNNNDAVTLPGVQTYITDSSGDTLVICNSDSEEAHNKIPHDSKKESPSSSKEDFPPISTIKAGILPCPTEPPVSGKMQGQWEIPLSFHPHDIPAASLASGVTAHAQAPIQGKAEAPQANSKTSAPPAAMMQQEAYDLLADFPALQPPKNPSALGAWRDGNPKNRDVGEGKGFVNPTSRRQERKATHQRRMKNVPRDVSSICAGDQKSVLDPQTLGRTSKCKAPPIGCKDPKANNQPPPRGNKSATTLCLDLPFIQ